MWISKAKYDKMVETIEELVRKTGAQGLAMLSASREAKTAKAIAEQAKTDAIHWKDKYIDLQWRCISNGWERMEQEGK